MPEHAGQRVCKAILRGDGHRLTSRDFSPIRLTRPDKIRPHLACRFHPPGRRMEEDVFDDRPYCHLADFFVALPLIEV